MTNRTFVGVTDTAWGATPGAANANWSLAFTPDATTGAILNGSSPSDVALTASAACLSLDCTGFTHTLIGATNDLDLYGNLTFSAGMSVSDLRVQSLDNDTTITSAGKTLRALIAHNGGVAQTVTLGDNLAVDYNFDLFNATNVNFGANTLTVTGDVAEGEFYLGGGTATWSAGAAIHFGVGDGNTYYISTDIQTELPPLTIAKLGGSGTGELQVYASTTVNAVTLTSGKFNLLGSTLTVTKDAALNGGTLLDPVGSTLVVGQNFTSAIDLIGSGEWFLNITGTSTLTPGITITHCTSTNAIDATGCVDGGNNSGNITFAVVNTAPVADAGDNQSVNTLNDIALDGSGTTDDGLPDPPGALTYLWSKVSGPGTVTFADATSAITTCSVSDSGTYVLRLTADDDDLNDTDDVTILVDAVAPYIANITGVSDTYVSTNHIDLTLTMSENVTKSGSVRLAIQLNNGVKYASYLSGDTTDTWVFRYTVGALDGASPLTAIGIDLNGGSMVDDLGNDMLLDAPIEGGAGSLSDNAEIIIDNTNDVVAPRPNHRRLGMLR